MMIVFDFIYFCIYSFIPDKAVLGKRDVACTLYSSFTSFLIGGLFTYCAIMFKLKINIVLVFIILFAGLFVLVRKIYLKPEKIRGMYCRFRKISKWLLKAIGIFYLLFCFVSFVILLIRVSLIVRHG